jgi:hypothetical protein
MPGSGRSLDFARGWTFSGRLQILAGHCTIETEDRGNAKAESHSANYRYSSFHGPPLGHTRAHGLP